MLPRTRAKLGTVDGIHDLGGVAGFGPVEVEPDEPAFHEEWERRAMRARFASMIALPADPGVGRHAIERMDPPHYLAASYYERWLTATATLLVESGLVSVGELEQRAGGRFPISRPDRGRPPTGFEPDRTEPAFSVGDRVRVLEWHPPGHTRAPRYVQGKRGVVARFDGPHPVPDIGAHGGGVVLDPTYSVRFTASELWGEGGADRDAVYVDLWERYLVADEEQA
jgi:nitrile hydratase